MKKSNWVAYFLKTVFQWTNVNSYIKTYSVISLSN